jgi:hypothetical protein
MPARRKAKSSVRSKPKVKARGKSLASKATGAAKKATREAKNVVAKVGRAAEVTRDVADKVANVAEALMKPSKKSGRSDASKRSRKKRGS